MKTLSNIFLKGLAAILPISLTIYIIYWLATSTESLLGSILKRFLPADYYWPGLGLIAGLLLIFIAGLLINAWLIRNLFQISEKLLLSLPLIKTIHGALKDLMNFISNHRKENNEQHVVSISFGDIQLIGFITHHEAHKLLKQDDQELVAVYLPLSYQIGGYTLFLPREKLTSLDISAEDAMRLVLTAGLSTNREN